MICQNKYKINLLYMPSYIERKKKYFDKKNFANKTFFSGI